MQKFYHSFWSKPATDSSRWNIGEQLKSNIWLYALSSEYVHRAGYEIHLITDSEGMRFFDCIDYDSSTNLLNCLKNCHLRLWAAGKIIAQSVMNPGDVHIDGDVFLKGKNLCKNIFDFDGDLLIQNGEDTLIGNSYNIDIYYQENINRLLRYFDKTDFPKEFDFSAKMALNCGIVCFKNQNLKEKYINGYLSFFEKMNTDSDFCSELSENSFACPDLITEQMYLYCVSKFYGSKIVALLSEFWNEETVKEAQRIGYTHLIGASKYQRIDEVKRELKKLNPELYAKVENKVNSL